MTPQQLLELSSKEARTLCLKFQNENTEMANNSKLATLTAVSSFFDHHDKPIRWKKNSKVRPRPDISSHAFSNGDLSKMFNTSDIRDKALLSLAVSLGWEIDGFLDLKKDRIIKHKAMLFGLVFLTAGFVLQIISNHLPRVQSAPLTTIEAVLQEQKNTKTNPENKALHQK